MAFLEIKNFNKTFSGNVKALDDINLTLEKGKKFTRSNYY